MSAAYPTPWTFDAEDQFEDSPIRAANGNYVLVRDSGVYPPDLETCREIVEAVNAVDAVLKLQRTLLGWYWERDRLRDLVRRLADSLDLAAAALRLANITQRAAITQPEPPRRYLHGVDIDALLREAREALGDGKQEGGGEC